MIFKFHLKNVSASEISRIRASVLSMLDLWVPTFNTNLSTVPHFLKLGQRFQMPHTHDIATVVELFRVVAKKSEPKKAATFIVFSGPLFLLKQKKEIYDEVRYSRKYVCIE